MTASFCIEHCACNISVGMMYRLSFFLAWDTLVCIDDPNGLVAFGWRSLFCMCVVSQVCLRAAGWGRRPFCNGMCASRLDARQQNSRHE